MSPPPTTEPGGARRPRSRGAWATTNRGNIAMRKELVRRLWDVAGEELEGAGRVLEVGTGGGWLLRSLADDAAPNRLVGIDIDAERIGAARTSLRGARFMHADARRLPFTDERFSLVIFASTLSSVSEAVAEQMVREAWRFVEPGGLLAVYDVRVPNPRNRDLRVVTTEQLQRVLGTAVQRQHLTLIPPISRRLGPLSPALYPVLATFPLWRSHTLWTHRKEVASIARIAEVAKIEQTAMPDLGCDEGWDPPTLQAAEVPTFVGSEPRAVEAGEVAEIVALDHPEEPEGPEDDPPLIIAPADAPPALEPEPRHADRDVHVWMFVRNPCVNDRRVLREAQFLADSGYRVTIIAVQRPGVPVREVRGRVEIVRVPILPRHYRVLRWYRRQPTAAVRRTRWRRRWRLRVTPLRRRWSRRRRLLRAKRARVRYLAARRVRLSAAGRRKRQNARARGRRLMRAKWAQQRRVGIAPWWTPLADLAIAALEVWLKVWNPVARAVVAAASAVARAVGKAVAWASRGALWLLRRAGSGVAQVGRARRTPLRVLAKARDGVWRAGRIALRPLLLGLGLMARGAAKLDAAARSLQRAPRRAEEARNRIRIARLVGDAPLAAQHGYRFDSRRDRLSLGASAAAWALLRLPLTLVVLLRVCARLALLPARFALWLLASACRLLMFPVHTTRTAAARVRPLVYDVLRRAVMIAHKPLLLEDYTRRATALVNERLDPDGGWRITSRQVFHAHDLNTLVAARHLARRTRSPLVYDSHELHTEASAAKRMGLVGRWGLRHYERYYIRRATRTITVCESLSHVLAARHGVDPPLVVRNTPEWSDEPGSESPLRAELGIPDDTRIALYHGNISAYRGLELLVDAAAELDGVAVVFLGSGALRPELEARVEERGLVGRVFFRDAVPESILNDYVASADVGVIPIQAHILNYYFSLPNKLFELMMAGKPVVAADLPEIRRVIERYDIGAIFRLDDSHALAEATKHVLNSPEYAAMSLRARSAAGANTWERERLGLLELYEDIAGDTHADFRREPPAAVRAAR